MTDEETIQAAVAAIDSMTDEQLTEWLANGDYASVGGVRLPEASALQLADAIRGAEVNGFAFDLGGGLQPGTGPGGPLGITHRKAGDRPLEYLKITMTEALITSVP